MSSTAAFASRVLSAPVVEPTEPTEPEVLGLDAVGTLGFAVERRRRQDEAAAEELRPVTHWADLHRVDRVGAVDPEVAAVITRRLQSGGGAGLLGVEGELRLAGRGAFGVCEFAVAELAAALGLSEPAGRAYVGQAVELRDRLPRCWDRVMAGTLPPWKARQIAERTIALTGDAADWVDAHLAPFAARISLGRVLRAVDAAVLRFDPDEARRRAAAAAENRGVWLEERIDGTTTITAVTDTPDAVAFDTTVDAVASGLRRLGDPDPHDVRRAKAVGVLADPQYALAVTHPEGSDPDPDDGPDTGPRSTGSPGTGGPVIHVHLHTDALTGSVHADNAAAVARVTGVPTPG